jgi:hypothetical protein
MLDKVQVCYRRVSIGLKVVEIREPTAGERQGWIVDCAGTKPGPCRLSRKQIRRTLERTVASAKDAIYHRLLCYGLEV